MPSGEMINMDHHMDHQLIPLNPPQIDCSIQRDYLQRNGGNQHWITIQITNWLTIPKPSEAENCYPGSTGSTGTPCCTWKNGKTLEILKNWPDHPVHRAGATIMLIPTPQYVAHVSYLTTHKAPPETPCSTPFIQIRRPEWLVLTRGWRFQVSIRITPKTEKNHNKLEKPEYFQRKTRFKPSWNQNPQNGYLICPHSSPIRSTCRSRLKDWSPENTPIPNLNHLTLKDQRLTVATSQEH